MSEVLPGIESGTTLEPKPDVVADGLPYISKSRIKEYKTCPRSFYYKYICGHREPTNYYMERGKQVHQAFEDYHAAIFEYVLDNDARPRWLSDLLGDRTDWQQWIDMVGNFFAFEERRWDETAVVQMGPVEVVQSRDLRLDTWTPIEVEAEAWLGEPPAWWVEQNGEPDYVSGSPPVGEAPWMGRADLIADSRSVPGVSGNGVTIIDYKTGKVPDEQYRDEGIYLEGEYYGMLFENFYDIDAVAGYYPATDEFIVSPYPDRDRRWMIKSAVLAMQSSTDIADFPIDEQPLCHYGHGKCWFYDICPSRWGQVGGPGHNKAGDAPGRQNRGNAPRYNP